MLEKKESTTYAPSQRQNHKQTSASGLLDEITTSEFFHVRILLGSINNSGASFFFFPWTPVLPVHKFVVVYISYILLPGTIVDRNKGTHKNYTFPYFSLTILGPIYFWPPGILILPLL